MKKLTIPASFILLNVVVFNVPATPPTPIANITSVMNGTVMVGTNVSASVGQTQAQTSTATLTGSSSLSVVNPVPTVANSITGTASSVATGTGYVAPTWNVVDTHGVTQGVSAISTGTVVTTIVDYPIVSSTITPSHDHD
jgi:hypothetical protein